VPTSIIDRALESRTKGGTDADVVVFEIADFQCPHCARFAATVAPELDERYVDTGLIQWVFVNLPLQNHAYAWHAAEAALCAGAAGDRFWAMHDRLFADQDRWTDAGHPGDRFARYAAELGVPADAYAACIAGDRVATLILQDFGSAVSAGINGTPTFIIMKDEEVVERLVGVQPVEEWARILDRALGR
jgi:protein-disulfide isomerase